MLYDYFLTVREASSCSIKNHNIQEKIKKSKTTQLDLITKIDLVVLHSTLKEILLRFEEQFFQSNLNIAQIYKRIQEASLYLTKTTGKPSYNKHNIDYKILEGIFSGNYPEMLSIEDIEIIGESLQAPYKDLLNKNTEDRLILDPLVDQSNILNVMELICYYERKSGELCGWAEFLPCSLEPPEFMEAHHQALYKHIIVPEDRDKLIKTFNTIGHKRRERVHSDERKNTSTFTHLIFKSALEDIAKARGDYINISPRLRRECLEFVHDKVADSRNRMDLIIADDKEADQVKKSLKGYDSMLLFGKYFTLWREPSGTVFYSANEFWVGKNRKLFDRFQKYGKLDVLHILSTLIKKIK